MEISDLFVVRLRWVRRESRGSIRAHSQGTSIFGCWPSAMHRNQLAAHSPAQSTAHSTHSAHSAQMHSALCVRGESDTLQLRLSALWEKEEESGTQCCVRKRGQIRIQHRVRKREESGTQHCTSERNERAALSTE